MQFLALDCAGNPSAWLDHETAIHLIASGRILAPIGEDTKSFGHPNIDKGKELPTTKS